MAKAPSKLKTQAALFPVPQSKDDVNDAIAKIGLAQRERARIQAAMNDELAAIKEKYETQAAPYNSQIEQLGKGVQTWCEANRDALTKDNKVKFAGFPSGEVKWRMRPPRVGIRVMENVLESLRKFGLDRMIRIKEEVNKEAILAEPDAVSGIAGIKIEQGEDFVIVPFETELEEVA